MKDVTIQDLINLTVSRVDKPEEIIKKIFEWYYDRTMIIIKGIAGLAVTIFVALLISHFKDELKGNPWWIRTVFVSPAIIITYSLYQYIHLKKLAKEYIDSLKIYSDLNKNIKFLELIKSIENQ